MRERFISVTVLVMVLAMSETVVAQVAPWSEASSALPPPIESTPAATADLNEHYGTTPDPAFSYNFQLPTARPLRHGDTMLQIASDLGWLSARYGFTRRFDAGVGVAYYLAGISFDARYAIVLTENVALSWWGYTTVPFVPGDGAPASFLGFNWQGAGLAWATGPVLSLWGARAGIHFGINAAQRILLGGLWAMGHVTVEGRITDGIRAIVQGMVLIEGIDERNGGATRSLVGNTQPRIFPYVVAGLRLHSRRFAVDFGLLGVLATNAPLSGGSLAVWPWTSVSQTF